MSFGGIERFECEKLELDEIYVFTRYHRPVLGWQKGQIWPMFGVIVAPARLHTLSKREEASLGQNDLVAKFWFSPTLTGKTIKQFRWRRQALSASSLIKGDIGPN